MPISKTFFQQKDRAKVFGWREHAISRRRNTKFVASVFSEIGSLFHAFRSWFGRISQIPRLSTRYPGPVLLQNFNWWIQVVRMRSLEIWYSAHTPTRQKFLQKAQIRAFQREKMRLKLGVWALYARGWKCPTNWTKKQKIWTEPPLSLGRGSRGDWIERRSLGDCVAGLAGLSEIINRMLTVFQI